MRKRFAALRQKAGTVASGSQGVLGAAFVTAGTWGLAGMFWALVVAGGFLLLGAWGS